MIESVIIRIAIGSNSLYHDLATVVTTKVSVVNARPVSKSFYVSAKAVTFNFSQPKLVQVLTVLRLKSERDQTVFAITF